MADTSNACNYSTLAAYTSGAQGINIVNIPSNLTSELIDPTYRTPGFSTLGRTNCWTAPWGEKKCTSNFIPNCSGFAKISNAYSKTGNNCNQQYVRQFCQQSKLGPGVHPGVGPSVKPPSVGPSVKPPSVGPSVKPPSVGPSVKPPSVGPSSYSMKFK